MGRPEAHLLIVMEPWGITSMRFGMSLWYIDMERAGQH